MVFDMTGFGIRNVSTPFYFFFPFWLTPNRAGRGILRWTGGAFYLSSSVSKPITQSPLTLATIRILPRYPANLYFHSGDADP